MPDTMPEDDSNGSMYSEAHRELRWMEIREAVQPDVPDFEAFEYGVVPGYALAQRWQDFQIIVRMASIELTPGKLDFPIGDWHIDGKMNEHIVASALYYFDSENVTTSRLAFRMRTDGHFRRLSTDRGAYTWMEQVYGTNVRCHDPFQYYGIVEAKEGRLIAYPNVFQHRALPFELEDKTKPGHCRFISLSLVDPRTTIIGTDIIPPQQLSWWVDRVFANLNESNVDRVHPAVAQIFLQNGSHPGLDAAAKRGHGLPAEILAMVQKELEDGEMMPMSQEEANEHWLKITGGRRARRQRREQ